MHSEPATRHPHAGDPVFDLHVGGKMETVSTVELAGADELSLAYTPGVARVCEAIAEDPSMTQHYTWVPNVVAVVTDGTLAVKRAAEARTLRDGTPGWWLLSDNPAEGVDSRHRGPVAAKDVLAVVRARLWPRPRPLPPGAVRAGA